MRRAAVPLLVLPVVLLAACGSDSGESGDAAGSSTASSSSSSSSSAGPGAPELSIAIEGGEGGSPVLATLSCSPQPSGAELDPAAACAALAGMADPFAALPADQMCTEQYGGPQTARITGRWAGAAVDLALARTNGCQIAQWDRLAPLLPVPVG